MSRPPRAPTSPFLLTCLLGLALASTSCAHSPTPGLVQVTVPLELAQACPRPDKTGVKTVGDLATFAIAGEADLSVCDARRAAAVQIIQIQSSAQAGLTKALQPKPWWKVW